ASGSVSKPIALWPSVRATTSVVPEPDIGSSTRSCLRREACSSLHGMAAAMRAGNGWTGRGRNGGLWGRIRPSPLVLKRFDGTRRTGQGSAGQRARGSDQRGDRSLQLPYLTVQRANRIGQNPVVARDAS